MYVPAKAFKAAEQLTEDMLCSMRDSEVADYCIDMAVCMN